MLKRIKKLLKDILTEDDGSSYCMARVCTFLGVLAFIAIGLIHAMKGIAIDLSAFGSGFGYILGGGGVAIGLKQFTSKEQDS
jgi:hypothetical protein